MPLIETLTLLEGGMPEPDAAEIVRALADTDVGQLATKANLVDLRAEMRGTSARRLRHCDGDFQALNADADLLLAFNTPLAFASARPDLAGLLRADKLTSLPR